MKWNGDIKPDHHIEYAFSCDGTPYFRFTDTFNIPVERAFDALHVFEEFQNRTDKEFLQGHIAAKKKIYNSNPIKLFELKKLDDQLEERLNMALPPARIVENLAAVCFFDETENPYKFDRGYAEQKKEKWRKGPVTDAEGNKIEPDFFLCQRLKDLMPSLELHESEIQRFLAITQKLDKEHLKTIFSLLSLNQRNHSLFKSHWFTSDTEKMSA